ncbi:MAG: SDR family NAD(P)-dependent oxidoreductase, partial [Bryobacteraceae bacterium]
MFDFSGKSVLVTGGTSGIGLAVAVAFSRLGSQVVAAGLPSSEPIPSTLRVETLDVTDTESVGQIVSKLSSLDFLVNAAGIISRDKEFELDTFTRVIDVNLT